MLVSEELGERVFGAGGARTVVVDPIDGSVNAKRGIPFFSFSLAVAEGPRWATSTSATSTTSVRARSGPPSAAGARFSTGDARGARPKDTIEILSFEGTTTPTSPTRVTPSGSRTGARHGFARALAVPPRGGPSRRRRLAQAGALGRHRGRTALVRECGLAIELFEDPPFEAAPLDLGTRSAPRGGRLAAARRRALRRRWPRPRHADERPTGVSELPPVEPKLGKLPFLRSLVLSTRRPLVRSTR